MATPIIPRPAIVRGFGPFQYSQPAQSRTGLPDSPPVLASQLADIPLTPEDQYILQRPTIRQEREYRIADRTDAEIARHRLQFGVVVCAVAKSIGPVRS